jgi:hypothetical protein
MVSSWTTNGKATTAGSLLVFDDNFGEDGLSSQSTYKVDIDDPYYKASIAPNPKVLNDLKPSKENLKIVYGVLMKEVNDLRLQINSKKTFLALILKAKASILILPKFKPKMCFFGLLMILNYLIGHLQTSLQDYGFVRIITTLYSQTGNQKSNSEIYQLEFVKQDVSR